MKYLNNKNGSTLILIILFIMLLMIIVVGLTPMLSFGVNSSVVQRNYQQAYYAAKTVNMSIVEALKNENNIKIINDSINDYKSKPAYYIYLEDNQKKINELNILDTKKSTSAEQWLGVNSDIKIKNNINVTVSDFKNNSTIDPNNYEIGNLPIKNLTSYTLLVKVNVSTTAVYKNQKYTISSTTEGEFNVSGGTKSKEWKEISDVLDGNDIIGTIKDNDVIVDANIYSENQVIKINAPSKGNKNVVIDGHILLINQANKIDLETVNGYNLTVKNIYVGSENAHEDSVYINNTKGNVTVGDIYTIAGVKIEQTNDSSTTLGNIYAKGNVTISNRTQSPMIIGSICSNGNITIENHNTATINIGQIITTGKLELKTGDGKIIIGDEIHAKGNVNIHTSNSISKFETKHIGTEGTISLTNNNGGEIKIHEYIHSKGNITLSNNNNGKITAKYIHTDGSISKTGNSTSDNHINYTFVQDYICNKKYECEKLNNIQNIINHINQLRLHGDEESEGEESSYNWNTTFY